jgi:hypothetical protein
MRTNAHTHAVFVTRGHTSTWFCSVSCSSRSHRHPAPQRLKKPEKIFALYYAGSYLARVHNGSRGEKRVHLCLCRQFSSRLLMGVEGLVSRLIHERGLSHTATTHAKELNARPQPTKGGQRTTGEPKSHPMIRFPLVSCAVSSTKVTPNSVSLPSLQVCHHPSKHRKQQSCNNDGNILTERST